MDEFGGLVQTYARGTFCATGTVFPVLEAGARVPDVSVWANIREEARPLTEILGQGLSFLAFYLYDWSPT